MSGMYSARSHGVVSAPSRLNELLDQVRTEFEAQQQRTNDYEHRRKF